MSEIVSYVKKIKKKVTDEKGVEQIIEMPVEEKFEVGKPVVTDDGKTISTLVCYGRAPEGFDVPEKDAYIRSYTWNNATLTDTETGKTELINALFCKKDAKIPLPPKQQIEKLDKKTAKIKQQQQKLQQLAKVLAELEARKKELENQVE